MELGTLELHILARRSQPSFSSAQLPKILNSLRNDIAKKAHHNATSRLAIDTYVEEHLICHHLKFFLWGSLDATE
eukprot:CAMPEP_0114495936 /NCGR_PEP_ID=MMETSP0109-20121206/5496_1 /TAXON_ID=29199 /ORGANISM="Chlorarachnion reptans, Strain CCCM449" /LENGTH=74 /DNA_ID=CAMNT_0001673163 /DNA_START=649 /DNA_END=873 /DNA_ORIENTATION=+